MARYWIKDKNARPIGEVQADTARDAMKQWKNLPRPFGAASHIPGLTAVIADEGRTFDDVARAEYERVRAALIANAK